MLRTILVGSLVLLLAPARHAGDGGGALRETERFTSAGAMAFDKLGWSVAVDANTALVSALEDDEVANDAGAAYVLERRGTGTRGWVEVKKLVAADGSANDQLGFSVALEGDWAALGCRYDDDNGTDSGSVYVFHRDQGGADAWGEVTKLYPPDPAATDWFGWSVALDGDTLVVGALQGGVGFGGAYVYAEDAGGEDAWGLVKVLQPSDAAEGDRFGRSVSIDGDRILVTADGNDDDGSSSGAAYVFARELGGAGNWGEEAKLTASDAFAVDHFGIAGAIDGDTAVVGAHRNDDLGAESGSAYVFERDLGGAGNWGEAKKLLAPDGAAQDSFGRAVALDGDLVLVGAYQHGHVGPAAGAAYVFGRDAGGTGNWGARRELLGAGIGPDDVFGWSLAIHGNDVLVGAPHFDETTSAPGAVHVYQGRPARHLEITLLWFGSR